MTSFDIRDPMIIKKLNEDSIIYDGIFLFADKTGATVDPSEITPGANSVLDGLADAPPAISGYRQADVAGMACWNCGHFTLVGDPDDDGDVDGICNLFEAKADGEFTCDRFTAHADLLRQSPHSSWAEDLQDMQRGPSVMEVDWSDTAVMNSIIFSGTTTDEEDNLVWKDILKTGTWTHTPTKQGLIKKALRIQRDGESDPAGGVLSLSEIYANFNDGAVPYVTVPLSDDIEDHKNIARLNTGFVKKLKLVDRDEYSVLRAGIDFTEPDVKEKVLRGTIPDVSAGVPFNVTRRADNRLFKTVLDHVCLTGKPFMGNLGPFGLAASDGEELPVEAWEEEAVSTEPSEKESEKEPEPSVEPANVEVMSFREQMQAVLKALGEQLRLSTDYGVEDIASNQAVVTHTISGSKWRVPFRITKDSENPVILASVNHWKLVEEEKPQTEPVAASEKTELQKAQELRELRLSQPNSQTGGIQMSVLSLDGVELSDDARARVQTILDENARLKKTSRETDVDTRIGELEKIPGMKERPGALKLYREVMLSDDGGAACVLFSDGPEDKKERLTAIQILDRFIDAVKGDEGIQLSDQHLESGNDKKPAKDASDERKPLEDRVAESNTALYGDRSKRRTGRK